LKSCRDDAFGAKGMNMKKKATELIIVFLMIVQSLGSLLFPVYLDTGWIKETWFGNDLVTLLLVCPMYLCGIFSSKKIFKLIRMGCLGYVIYNYAFYLLGTELNKLFLLYVAIISITLIEFIRLFNNEEESKSAYDYFDVSKNYLVPGLIFIFIGFGLGAVWLGFWASYSFFGGKLPTEQSAFRLVAALDLIIIVNAMLIAGIELIRKRKIGFVVGTIIGIQGSLYLLILSLNSFIFSYKNNNFPGEIPIWGTLFLIETVGIVSLLIKRNKRRIPTIAST